MSADTEALATVREDALRWLRGQGRMDGGVTEDLVNGLLAALDALAAELEAAVDPEDYKIMEGFWIAARERAEAAEAELERTQKIAEAHKGANKLLVDEYEAKLTAHVESMQAAEAELERVKAERDAQAERLTAYETPGWINSVQKVLDERDKRKAAEARLDKALTALREIASAPTFPIRSDEIARAAIKDIEA